MKNLQIGELKAKFSKVLEDVRQGEEFTISFGKKKEKIAVIVPYSKYNKTGTRVLGILEKKASYKINGSFAISEEDLLDS